MQVRTAVALAFISLFLLGCFDKRTLSIDAKDPSKYEIDSLSKQVLQTFSAGSSDSYKYDSTSLIFYCSRNYDTSSLIEISKHDQVISGVYYQILPEYHRFRTDYADKASKLIFFEGYSFIVDSTEWKSIVSHAKLVLNEKRQIIPHQKVTDAATYALLYDNQIQRGSTGDLALENFDLFLKSSFLREKMSFKRRIMQKDK